MITMQNVRKTYGNFTFEISMELPEGQILGLIGKNGYFSRSRKKYRDQTDSWSLPGRGRNCNCFGK